MVHSSSYWLKQRTTFHHKNKLFTYLSNTRKLISFYAGKDGRDGINGDVVIYSKWIFDLDGKYFQRDSFINKKWQGLFIFDFLRGGGGLVEDLRGKHGLRGKRLWWGIIRILKSLRGGSGKFNHNSTKILGLTNWLVPYGNLGREKKPKLVTWWLHVSS